MLATALELKETFSTEIHAFHTFDDGKGQRGPEGKGIPLLSYHEWCEGLEEDPLAKRIIELNRCLPIHPSPQMVL